MGGTDQRLGRASQPNVGKGPFLDVYMGAFQVIAVTHFLDCLHHPGYYLWFVFALGLNVVCFRCFDKRMG